MCLTLFATPYGIKGALYSLNVNTSGEFPIFSSETQSISSLHNSSPVMDNIPIALFPFLAALLLVSFLIRLREKPFSFKHFPIFYFLASVSTILLGFKVIRSLPMFGLIFLPAICENLNPSFIRLRNYIHRKSPEIKRIFKIAFLTLFLGLIIYLTLFARGIIAPYTKIGLGLAPGSLDASNFMKENKIKGPIFNDTDIGSYLIGQLYPDEKVFVDNRFGDAYSADFFANVYIPMSKDEDSWVHLSEKYKINTVVFYQYDGGSGARDFLYRRIYDPLWAWVYADRGIVILVKNTEENREIVEKFQITKDNIRDRLSHLESSSNMDDVLGVADLYSLVGLSDFATEVYLRIVSEYPNRGKIWMILGGIELKKVDQQSSNPALALIYLQNAINAGWKTPESYSYLALAHYRIGNTDKAKEAVDKQLKIDPNNQDGKKWLEVFAEDELKK
jgi:tetratricopeptide (TPR) repeat protein